MTPPSSALSVDHLLAWAGLLLSAGFVATIVLAWV
jgi:hypothetical protein